MVKIVDRPQASRAPEQEGLDALSAPSVDVTRIEVGSGIVSELSAGNFTRIESEGVDASIADLGPYREQEAVPSQIGPHGGTIFGQTRELEDLNPAQVRDTGTHTIPVYGQGTVTFISQADLGKIYRDLVGEDDAPYKGDDANTSGATIARIGSGRVAL